VRNSKLDDNVDINRVWGIAGEQLKTSDKQNKLPFHLRVPIKGIRQIRD
jgi:hypothetical protein